MAKKYYAVAVGKTPGIYLTWDDCKTQVAGFPGAVYKGFDNINDAENFLGVASVEKDVKVTGIERAVLKTEDDKDCQRISTDTCLVAYVDGSYDDTTKRYAYGCVLVFDDEVVKLNGDNNDEEYVSMRNVAGEILGSETAIKWAAEHGYKEVVIYYDYEGIEKWANNIWKANKPGTIRYKEFIKEQRKKIKITFVKVAAHTGVTYNEMADRLAKEALDLI
ncbi:MAG: ribonuclease H family protein [Lachnospiraceae bacterium]|nr:ribonuclease H family protein [Lachnospiraceae bacterium]